MTRARRGKRSTRECSASRLPFALPWASIEDALAAAEDKRSLAELKALEGDKN
ncbi:MAG: hypothetical protein RL385_1768 [Pseudomonadota bacterium]|jgi:hypothetical protein